jgi:hypothetical protein
VKTGKQKIESKWVRIEQEYANINKKTVKLL